MDDTQQRILRMIRSPSGARYVDTFDVLSPHWQVLNGGTIAAVGGALRATAAGNWGNQLVTNGESWTGGPPPTGWTDALATAVQVDSTVDPGVGSGGVDSLALLITRTNTGGWSYTSWPFPVASVVGAMYVYRALAYSPSSNTFVNATNFAPVFGVASPTTVEDVWQAQQVTGLATTTTNFINVVIAEVTGLIGEKGYVDSVTTYRQNTPCRLLDWPVPNHQITADIIMPAAAVTPRSVMVRYTDPLNYWEVRVVPNTAGNDLAIYQVTAGVETSRGVPVDVDWTASGTDQLRVRALGATISTQYKKTGVGVWADGPSYNAAAQGISSPINGPMLWDTLAAGPFAQYEIVAL